MSLLRTSILHRILWGFMALYIFNFSVDAPDLQPDYHPEDLSINDMESVVEIILEKVIKIEDAIPEHDEDDSRKTSNFSLEKHFDFHPPVTVDKTMHPLPFFMSQSNKIYLSALFHQFFPEITSPPPEV